MYVYGSGCAVTLYMLSLFFSCNNYIITKTCEQVLRWDG